MIDHEKLPKLIKRMQHLVTYLNDRNDLVVHQQLNQSFYLQKIDELTMLTTKFDEIKKSLDILTSGIEENYNLCFEQWRKDARWLNSYKLNKRRKAIL
jgi:nitrous oxide reductase